MLICVLDPSFNVCIQQTQRATARPQGLISPRQECTSQYLISCCRFLLEPEKVTTEQEKDERQVSQRVGVCVGTLELREVTYPVPATARSIKMVRRITTHLWLRVAMAGVEKEDQCGWRLGWGTRDCKRVCPAQMCPSTKCLPYC